MKYLLAIIGICLIGAPIVIAQETPLKAARDEYQYQAESYRKALDKYQVDQAAYGQNPSYTNQEILILSAKKLLAAQAQVWYSYFKAMGIDLEETTGRASESAVLVAELNQKQNDLSLKLGEYNRLTEKAGVMNSLTEANTAAAQYKLEGARIQALIKFYRMRYALNQLGQFKNNLAELIPEQITNPLAQESQLRAVAEAENLLTAANTAYEAAMTEFNQAPASGGDYMLDQAKEKLTPIYNQVDRSARILREAAEGVEL